MLGDLFTADGLCRRIADQSGAVVVSVDYRRAPEHPVPAAHHDAVAAAQWAVDHCAELGGDPARIVMGGDSAGGCLAAHTARVLRDGGGQQAALQVLIYPATDLSLGHADWDPALAKVLDHDTLHWFARQSMPDMSQAERRGPEISPMFADDLSGLPPALLITAGVDPVRSDGVAYAQRLRDAGTAVDHRDYPGQIHGFVGMDLLFPAAARALDAVARAISEVRPVAVAPRPTTPEPISWNSASDEVRSRVSEAFRRLPPVNAAPMLSTLIEHRGRTAARFLRSAGSRGRDRPTKP